MKRIIILASAALCQAAPWPEGFMTMTASILLINALKLNHEDAQVQRGLRKVTVVVRIILPPPKLRVIERYYAAGSEDGGRGHPPAKECRQPPKTGKGEKLILSLDPPPGTQPC